MNFNPGSQLKQVLVLLDEILGLLHLFLMRPFWLSTLAKCPYVGT